MTVTSQAPPHRWQSAGSPLPTAGARHITHRPTSAEEFLLGVTAPDDCRFTVSDRLSRVELPFEDDAPGPTHDLHYVTEVIHSVARLAADHHLRLPAGRPLKVTSGVVNIGDTELWRHTGRAGSATVDLRLRSTRYPGGAARLECAADVLVRGAPYATGLLALWIDGDEGGDGGGPREDGPGHPDQAWVRPSAARVGRSDRRNVVLANVRSWPGGLLADIAPDPDNPAFDPAANRRADIALVVEATRQAAVLTAGELHGFVPTCCVPVRWSARLATEGACGPPLRCAVHLGPVVRDEAGRSTTTVTVVLSGDHGPVGTVAVTVVQDC